MTWRTRWTLTLAGAPRPTLGLRGPKLTKLGRIAFFAARRHTSRHWPKAGRIHHRLSAATMRCNRKWSASWPCGGVEQLRHRAGHRCGRWILMLINLMRVPRVLRMRRPLPGPGRKGRLLTITLRCFERRVTIAAARLGARGRRARIGATCQDRMTNWRPTAWMNAVIASRIAMGTTAMHTSTTTWTTTTWTSCLHRTPTMMATRAATRKAMRQLRQDRSQVAIMAMCMIWIRIRI